MTLVVGVQVAFVPFFVCDGSHGASICESLYQARQRSHVTCTGRSSSTKMHSISDSCRTNTLMPTRPSASIKCRAQSISLCCQNASVVLARVFCRLVWVGSRPETFRSDIFAVNPFVPSGPLCPSATVSRLLTRVGCAHRAYGLSYADVDLAVRCLWTWMQ